MNRVELIGRLTRDPEVRYTESGSPYCRFNIAIDRQTKEGGADFPTIVCFGRTAENMAKFVRKGREIGVEGRIQTGRYENKNGDTVYTTDVIASRIEFIGSADRAVRAPETGEPKKPRKGHEVPMEDFEALDDDVPF